MSTTVSYKGSTIATATNQTKVLETSGTWLEDDITITDVTAASNLQAKSNIDPTTSSQTITADYGYDGLSSVQINAMPAGSASPADAISGTGASAAVSGTNLMVSKTVSNLPRVTPGYVAAATWGSTDVTLYTPATNLEPGNIKNNVTIFGVTGTYTGGGGTDRLVLLNTTSLGTLSTSVTSGTDTGKSVTVSGINAYEMLVFVTSVDTQMPGRHASTTAVVFLVATDNLSTKTSTSIATAKYNIKLSSSLVATGRSATTAYGIYPYTATINNGSLTAPMYYRYNSTYTGTINNAYTTRVYGVKLKDLIGG